MLKTLEIDIAIFGGGVAGLWLLNTLCQRGFSVILLEKNQLGGGQTGKSQGIIHGGMKYALQGTLTPSARAIAMMPEVWKACLQGQGEIDLSKVPILSDRQYLWSTNLITSKLAGFFAGLSLKGQVEEVRKSLYPEIFQHPNFKGQVYSLDEIVIDVNVLVKELAESHCDKIFKIDGYQEMPDGILIQIEGQKPVLLKAKKHILTAGVGNEHLETSVPMQRRALHMIVAKTNVPTPVFGHCLGLSAVPRMTITTHKAKDGKNVWYLGGQIAEEGVSLSSEKQIAKARAELQKIFSWIDFSNVPFASFIVERAEALQNDGNRPDSFYLKMHQQKIVAWPTKLAFAPELSKKILETLSTLQPTTADLSALADWPKPSYAAPIWDELL